MSSGAPAGKSSEGEGFSAYRINSPGGTLLPQERNLPLAGPNHKSIVASFVTQIFFFFLMARNGAKCMLFVKTTVSQSKLTTILVSQVL